MNATAGWNLKFRGGVLCALAVSLLAFQAVGHTQNANLDGLDDTLQTYARGQSVVPIFGGWIKNPDGTYDLVFSYLNRNWQEEVDIPIGPDNNIQPAQYGPDGGQPTHFLPRNNRWVFTVKAPANFGPTGEVIWTLTSHGQTLRAYASLKNGYVLDDYTLQHEYSAGAADASHERKPPDLQVPGAKQRTVKVGEATQLIATAVDKNAPLGGGRRRGAAPVYPAEVGPGPVGGQATRDEPPGLRFAWFVYRGDAKQVTFSPKMAFKVWEDLRGGSPWAPGWQPPPIPADNTWRYTVTFKAPGTYMLRGQAHNGTHFSNEDVTFTVTP
jgi:hypothetical protein